MTPKEFKAEMQQLVANAECKVGCEGTQWEYHEYKSVVNGRTYTWTETDPQVFANELIKKFQKNTREISKGSNDLHADNWFIDQRQKTLAFLWNHKETWKGIIALYEKYSEHREAVNNFLRRCKYYSWDKGWNRRPENRKMDDLCKEIGKETRKLTGREDLFYLYDTMPCNWLAMA